MKSTVFMVLLLAGFAVYSQPDVDAMLATSVSGNSMHRQANEQLKKFIQPLSVSRLSDQKLLRKTFHRLHAEFLKKYEAYADFDKLFSTGHYDCLTATALFSLVLDRLNFSYEIIETNYHIFLLVQTSKGEVLLETTDRFAGFVTDKDAIAQRTSDYRKNVLTADQSGRFFYPYHCNLYQNLSPEKLTGLLYFNHAVKAYNARSWLESSMLLEKANAWYASPRCEELGIILIKTVMESSLDEIEKSGCLLHLRSFWIKKSETVASN